MLMYFSKLYVRPSQKSFQNFFFFVLLNLCSVYQLHVFILISMQNYNTMNNSTLFSSLHHSHTTKYSQRTKEINLYGWYLKMGQEIQQGILEFMSHVSCDINHLLYFVRSNYVLRDSSKAFTLTNNIFERKTVTFIDKFTLNILRIKWVIS